MSPAVLEDRVFPDVIGQWHWELLLDGRAVVRGVCRSRRQARRRLRFTRAYLLPLLEHRLAARDRERERDLNANGC